MSFNIVVPNGGQSPGLFPAQNNTNYQRLQAIIDAEHNFTNGFNAAQGIHKQCTFINRTSPVGLPAGNGILYSQADSGGASQLRWYNGITPDQQITRGLNLVSFGSIAINTTPALLYTFPAGGAFGLMYFWIDGVKSMSAMWTTDGSTVNAIATSFITSILGPQYVNFSNTGLALSVATPAGMTGTFNYLIYKLG